MPTLSPRQSQMLTLLAQGHSVKTAANSLGITYYTGKHHVCIAIRKLSACTATQAVCIALQRDIIHPYYQD